MNPFGCLKLVGWRTIDQHREKGGRNALSHSSTPSIAKSIVKQNVVQEISTRMIVGLLQIYLEDQALLFTLFLESISSFAKRIPSKICLLLTKAPWKGLMMLGRTKDGNGAGQVGSGSGQPDQNSLCPIPDLPRGGFMICVAKPASRRGRVKSTQIC